MAMIYCYECGKKYSGAAKQCPNCGATNKTARRGLSDKNIWAALILAWIFGMFGGHRFYVGKTGSAIAMLILTCTLVGMIITGIWLLIDFITIICGGFTDSDGKPLGY